MALPIIPAWSVLVFAMKRTRSIVYFVGILAATGFSLSSCTSQVADTALSLWPLLALICFFLLAREVKKSYFEIKKSEKIKKEGED